MLGVVLPGVAGLRFCLVSNSARTLALPFDCGEGQGEFDPAIARRLDELRLRALDEPSDSPLRQLMTAVTVTRRLREVVRLNDDTVITPGPVTREVYGLFAASAGVPAPPQPADNPDAPAVGMSRSDALHLVRWINELLPDGNAYRLPTGEEVTDPAFDLTARSSQHAVWYSGEDPDVLPDLWLPRVASFTFSSSVVVLARA